MKCLRALAFIPVAALLSCSSLTVLATGGAGVRCPSKLVPVAELPDPLRFSVTSAVERRGETDPTSLHLERSGERLVLVQLARGGAKRATVIQEGARSRVEFEMGGGLVHPAGMLAEVHRSYFFALPGAPLPDGRHRGTRAGQPLEEVWSDGILRERHFDRPEVALVFDGGLVRIENRSCGYEATLRRLPEGGSSASEASKSAM